MAAESNAEPLLSLDTLIVRPTVEIDGTRYEILSPNELGVLDARRFALWAQQLEAFEAGEAESPEQVALIDTIARKVLAGVPQDLFEKLTGVQRIAVVEVFIALLLRSRMGAVGAVRTAMGNRPIGASFYPGSSDSMAARPVSGWRRYLPRWSWRTSR